jgi:hypothetical protein
MPARHCAFSSHTPFSPAVVAALRSNFVYLQSFLNDFERPNQDSEVQTESIRAAAGGFANSNGPQKSIRIPASVEASDAHCVAGTTSFGVISLEPDSQLHPITCRAFVSSVIQSIAETIPKTCVAKCLILSDVTFQSRSQLRTIGTLAFSVC